MSYLDMNDAEKLVDELVPILKKELHAYAHNEVIWKGALRKYGQHITGCPASFSVGPYACTCDWAYVEKSL